MLKRLPVKKIAARKLPPPAAVALGDPSFYMNRELSLLEFQHRVLEEAADPGRSERDSVIGPQAPVVPTMYLGMDGTGIPMRAAELAGRAGKQPDGSARTREVKLVTVWTAEGRDAEGIPVRDSGSVSYSAAIESAASRDTDAAPSEFARRAEREAQRRRTKGENLDDWRAAISTPTRLQTRSQREHVLRSDSGSPQESSGSVRLGRGSPERFSAALACRETPVVRRRSPDHG